MMNYGEAANVWRFWEDCTQPGESHPYLAAHRIERAAPHPMLRQQARHPAADRQRPARRRPADRARRHGGVPAGRRDERHLLHVRNASGIRPRQHPLHLRGVGERLDDPPCVRLTRVRGRRQSSGSCTHRSFSRVCAPVRGVVPDSWTDGRLRALGSAGHDEGRSCRPRDVAVVSPGVHPRRE